MSLRMVEGCWTRWMKADLNAECQSVMPVAGLLDIQKRLNIKRGPKRARRCAMCDAPCRTKCSHCLAAHYCSFGCQRQDWPNHRLVCQQPSPQIAQYTAVMMPDYQCFWKYQEQVSARWSSEHTLALCIMSREAFAAMFGEDAVRRTVLSLALHGRPQLYVASLFAMDRSCNGTGVTSSSTTTGISSGTNSDCEMSGYDSGCSR